jgi:hypothetical protein
LQPQVVPTYQAVGQRRLLRLGVDRPRLRDVAFGLRTLTLENNTLQFFEYYELLVRVINLGIALFFADQEPGFFEPLELALDIASVFFDEFGETTNVRLEIGILRIDHNDLAPHS